MVAVFVNEFVEDAVPAYKVVVVAFVAVMTFPVNAPAIKEPMFAMFEYRLLDDAVPVNEVVDVALAAVTFWKSLVPVNVLFEYVFGTVVEACM
jgi:hypothetical protein